MKIALLIKPDPKQFIITPETEEEKNIFKMVPVNEDVPFSVMRGSFYESCKGGWQREYPDDDSIMFVFSKKQP